MRTIFSFVSMCALLFVVYFQINYIKADWCQAEVDLLRLNSDSIINHFNIEREE
jgi:hypothetical protein